MPIEELLFKDKPLASVSTLGIGGPARFFLEVKNIPDLEEAFAWAKKEKMPVFILGRGSNSLFDDRGFDGLVIQNRIDFCENTAGKVVVGAGYNFSLLGVQTARQGYSGLEFASGIPGTVGGAVFMNAGANGGETFDCLKEVLFFDAETMQKKSFSKEALTFGYRTSSFQTLKGCILSAEFHLSLNPEARKLQLSIVDYRLKTQPYKDKSIGCIFRNPSKQLSAGALIDKCCLKGKSVGAAGVSPMHANFIVNQGGAKASDVEALIELVQKQVFEETGIHLEPEVRRIPWR